MKAIQIKEYGDEGVLNFSEVPTPKPAANEILVKIKAAAINPVDIKIRNGKGKTFGLHLPLIPGADFAGTVAETGADITKFKKGDEVYGKILIGCYAEYVTVKEGELSLKPKNTSFEEAASLPMGTITAWQAIFEGGNLTEGQTILVHGASGGVGSMAVQLAKAKGARVIASASGANRDFVVGLGADDFINYKTEDFTAKVKEVDVVFDPVGGETHKKSYRVLKKGGALVSLVEKPDEALKQQYGVKSEYISSRANADQLEKITKLVEAGKIKTRIHQVFPLKEVVEATQVSEEGHVQGKIILKP